MSDERWPYGTVVEHRDPFTVIVAMVVRDDRKLMLTTLADPNATLLPAHFYDKVWEWTAQRYWWTRVEGT